MVGKVISYFGTTCYPVVLIILIAYLIWNKKSDRSKCVLYALILFVIGYPILYIACNRIGQEAETYRFFWIIPLGITWAYGMVFLWRKKKLCLGCGLLLFALTFWMFGFSKIDKDNWSIPDNAYVLSDEIIDLSDMILDDVSGRPAKVIGEPEVMIQIRQYSSDLYWAYTGRGQMVMAQSSNVDEEYSTDFQYRLAMAIQQGIYIDEALLLSDLHGLGAEFIMLSNDNAFVEHLPEGTYSKLGSTKHYSAYKMDYPSMIVPEFSVDSKDIVIPGLSRDYHFAVINDSHIMCEEDLLDNANDTDMLSKRYADFTIRKASSYETWEKLYPKLDSLQADAILFNGDMLDYYSDSNFMHLKSGLDTLTTPYIYLRADHDIMPYWCKETDEKAIEEKERDLDQNPEVALLEYDDFVIMGINMNTFQMSSSALNQVKEIFAKGKPVILVAHVPYDSSKDDSLANASKEIWKDRVLLWGLKESDYYEADDTTQEFLDLLYEKESPVVAIVGAHLHFAHESEFKTGVPEFVFDASYKGSIGYLNVYGEE